MTFRMILALAGMISLAVAVSFAKAPGDRNTGEGVRSAQFPAPAYDPAPAQAGLQNVVLAGGCFWGVQAVFQHVAGVEQAVSGYAGGGADVARYDRVSQGDTGHAESVRVVYDPARVSLGQILRVFFAVAHDPTELNRQGPDEGSQYRSAVFVADPAQERVVRAYIEQLQAMRLFQRPIVTRIEPLERFYPAEAHHQDYLIHHPDAPYVVINDLPKIEALKKTFPALYRETPKPVGTAE